MLDDFIYILLWWATLFGIGLIFLPLTKSLFKGVTDSFYIFSKIIGVGIRPARTRLKIRRLGECADEIFQRPNGVRKCIE